MHLHAGVLEGLNIWLAVLVFGFFWRYLSMKWHDKPIGQAMAFIY